MNNIRKVFAHGKIIEVETIEVGPPAPKSVRSRKRYIKFPGLWEEVLAKPREWCDVFGRPCAAIRGVEVGEPRL